VPGLAFELPPALEAHEPPEARGLARDDVRLLVATRGDGGVAHARFRDLADLLVPGDLLVVNVSATLPAAVAARRADGSPIELRFATPAPDMAAGAWWVVELRSADGTAPVGDGREGERIALECGASVDLSAPYAAGRRLWLARLRADAPLHELLARHGHPIRYGYVPDPWPTGAVQAGAGWTSLVIDADRGLRAIDGLISGWHEPHASHLALLEAAAGPELLARSYEEALAHGYLWHEFGDSHLVLP
jgi:S-adenosylmethionine:tRNA ribosyltransferase-isomerase